PRRVLPAPAASAALARLLTGPRWRIGPRDLVALGRRARDLAREPREGAGPGTAQREGTQAGHDPGRHQAGPGGESPGSRDEGSGVWPEDDPLAQAGTGLAAGPGSVVEALDDLGDRGAYSAKGYQRFSALAAELRALRGHVSRPLPDLVGEVERTLGLDIEVAAQPWRDPTVARADLDAFADA